MIEALIKGLAMTGTKERSIELAKALIDEFGGQSKAAHVVGIKQPSVWRWSTAGISAIRENDLRYRFPKLKVWTRFPPLNEAR